MYSIQRRLERYRIIYFAGQIRGQIRGYIVGECFSSAADTHLATDLTCKVNFENIHGLVSMSGLGIFLFLRLFFDYTSDTFYPSRVFSFISITRSLGALQALTSSRRTFGPP